MTKLRRLMLDASIWLTGRCVSQIRFLLVVNDELDQVAIGLLLVEVLEAFWSPAASDPVEYTAMKAQACADAGGVWKPAN